jgi:glycosyltransferase involved in cell wall biosynthesis
MNIPVSVTVITKNAAATLERCLNSVAWANEIIVVDSGSTDNTLQIATKLAHKVEHKDWAGYGAQKRYAVSLATYDWVLSIDADEWLSEELANNIQLTLNENSLHVGYKFNCCNYFMGRWLRHGEGYPDPHLRLFNRRYGNWQDLPIHEQVIVNGIIGKLTGDLFHQSALSLETYIAKQNNYTQVQANLLWQQGIRTNMLQLILRPFWRFIRFYILKLGYLDGIPGLVHISIGCFNTFIKYAKLYELQTQIKS